MTNLITTSDEQVAYNRTVCEECKLERWQHVNAIMCTDSPDVDPTFALVLDLTLKVESMAEQVAEIRAFIAMLQQAIESNPMAQMIGLG